MPLVHCGGIEEGGNFGWFYLMTTFQIEEHEVNWSELIVRVQHVLASFLLPF